MKRRASKLLLLAALVAWSGPVQAGNYMSSAWSSNTTGGARYMREAQGMVGPYGQPVIAVAPPQEPTGADYAQSMLMRSYPPEVIQQMGFGKDKPEYGHGWARGAGQPGYGGQGGYGNPAMCGPMGCPPGGMPGGPMMPGGPGGPMMPPGMMPPGMLPPGMTPPAAQIPPNVAALASRALDGPPGAVAAVGSLGGPGGYGGAPFGVSRTEVRFGNPAGMKVSWYSPKPDGTPGFTTQYLETPARYNFLQASIYRLKLSDIPNRPGVELYPTLEVVPSNAKTTTFLAHAAVPVNFTEEDFEQVTAGNFIVKVIYLPDPQFQELANGPDEVVSSRLEPGVDPIIEAKRRGCILAIVRLGNIDLEAPNTPAMDAPGKALLPPGYAPNNLPPGNMAPRGMGMMPPNMPMIPGMPNVPMIPGMQPANSATPPKAAAPARTNTPSAPTTPLPLKPENKAPATPLGRLPIKGDVVPASATVVQPARTPSRMTSRSSLSDLLGKPTTER